VAFTLLQVRLRGQAWWWAAAAVPVAAGAFLLLAGRPYLRMLGLFAGGLYNFIVEPLPHVLFFLLAAVWLVPRMLAAEFRRDEQQAAVLGACFVWDGIGIFLLSFVAMTARSRWKQAAWGVCVAGMMLTFYHLEVFLVSAQIREVVHRTALAYPNSLPSRAIFLLRTKADPEKAKLYMDSATLPVLRFDVDALARMVGNDTVATPYEVPAGVEEQMRERGLYRPDFYFFMVGVLDRKAEDRKIGAFNEARWAMLPDSSDYRETETQKEADVVLEIPLPYRAKRVPYVVGVRFSDNLRTNWRKVGRVDEYVVYCNLRNNAGCAGQ
jgi:hypothetical protein